MDNRLITSMIRTVIWPVLKTAGFATFTGRSAWRHWPEGVDVVNIQGYGPARHPELFANPTGFSFAVNLGVWLDYLPYDVPAAIKVHRGVQRPAEYQCPLRRQLSSYRPGAAPTEADFWFIEPDGANASTAVDDALVVIEQDGLPWLERFHYPEEVLRTLLTEQVSGVLHGCGAISSPVRSYLTAYAARRMGDTELAVIHLEQVATSTAMSAVKQQVLDDLATLRTGTA